MQRRRRIERLLDRLHRHRGHPHVEPAAGKHTVFPEEWQQGLRNHDVRIERLEPRSQHTRFPSRMRQRDLRQRVPRLARDAIAQGLFDTSPTGLHRRSKEAIVRVRECREVRRIGGNPPRAAQGMQLRRAAVAGRDAARMAIGDPFRGPPLEILRILARRRVTPDAHDECVGIHRHFQPPRERGTQAKVDVVPEHRGIAVEFRERAGQHARMAMAFDHVDAGTQRRIVDRIRQQAQAAADRRHQAAFAQLASVDEAASPRRAPELAPEAPRRTGGGRRRVECAQGHAQVLHLARGQRAIGAGVVPERGARFAEDRCIAQRIAARMSHRPGGIERIAPCAHRAQSPRLRDEQQGLGARRHRPFHGDGAQVVHIRTAWRSPGTRCRSTGTPALR